MQRLNRNILHCQLCPIHRRPPPACRTPGIGSVTARVFLVGEAPGEEETKPSGFSVGTTPTGRPFVGTAGTHLRTILRELGYVQDDVYVSNVLKCRPPNNRTPRPEERQACSRYLISEIATVSPRVIVALGKSATTALAELANHKLPSRSLRNHYFIYNQFPVFSTWHPAYACCYAPDKRPELVADLKHALEFSHATHPTPF